MSATAVPSASARLVIDVTKKMPLLRKLPKSDKNENKPIKMAPVVRKVINIPICDVTVDADYETNIRPDYTIPASYVRHVRKIGDEGGDMTVAYNLEADDKVKERQRERKISQTHRKK